MHPEAIPRTCREFCAEFILSVLNNALALETNVILRYWSRLGPSKEHHFEIYRAPGDLIIVRSHVKPQIAQGERVVLPGVSLAHPRELLPR